jgi:hypothetical protein
MNPILKKYFHRGGAMKQKLIGLLTSVLSLAAFSMFGIAPSPVSAAQQDMTARRNLYQCQQKTAEYVYNLDKVGDQELFDKHLQDCLETAKPLQGPLKATAMAAGFTTTTVTVNNMRGKQITVYVNFNADSCYQPKDFSSFCKAVSGNSNKSTLCTFDLPVSGIKQLVFDKSNNGTKCKASFVITADYLPQTDCAVTQAEFTIRDFWDFNKKYMDSYDISLVNGFNGSVSIVPSKGTTAGPVTKKLDNQDTPLTFPFACDTCTGRSGPPPSCKNDPDFKIVSQCKKSEACQKTGVESVEVSSYMVNFLP